MDIRKCRLCGAEIYFVRDIKGDIHPLDAKAPVYRIDVDLTGSWIAGRSDGYVSHFTTCPKKDEFFRLKRQAEAEVHA